MATYGVTMGVGVRVKVLGPIAVVGAERELAPTLRRLLAALVARRGATASNDALIDAMWPEGPPGGDGLRALRTAVSRLRPIVGADAVMTAAPGYRLVLAARSEDKLQALAAECGGPDRAVFELDNLYLYGGLFDTAAILLGRLVPMDIYDLRHLVCGLIGVGGLAAGVGPGLGAAQGVVERRHAANLDVGHGYPSRG